MSRWSSARRPAGRRGGSPAGSGGRGGRRGGGLPRDHLPPRPRPGGPRGRPVPPPAQGAPAARVPPRPKAARRLHPARALDREPAGGGRDARGVRAPGGRPADLPQGGRQGQRDLACGAESRFTFLLPNEDKRSAAVIAGIADALRGLPEDARRTITLDRGSEFAGYATLGRDPAVASYSCDPHSPWQRGGVENLNGRARRAASCRAAASPRRLRRRPCGGWPTGSTTRRGAASATGRPGRSSGSIRRPRRTRPEPRPGHLSHFA